MDIEVPDDRILNLIKFIDNTQIELKKTKNR